MTQTTDKKTETILTYTGDVHALVTHGLQAIHRQTENLKNVSHEDARVAVKVFETTLAAQKTTLEARLSALGGKATTPVKDAVSGALGAVAGVINKGRSSETAKSIRDDYTFFSHLAVAWLMLHTTARALGDAETAAVAENGYKDTARMIMHIDKILPKIVVEELNEEKELSPKDVRQDTVQMVKDAWNREAPTGI